MTEFFFLLLNEDMLKAIVNTTNEYASAFLKLNKELVEKSLYYKK